MLLIPPAFCANLGKVVSIVLRPWFEASMTDTRQPLKYDEFSSQNWEGIIYFRCSTGPSAKTAVAGASGDFGDPFWTAAFTMVCCRRSSFSCGNFLQGVMVEQDNAFLPTYRL